MATVVAIITSMVVANATQTITTPNAVNITYSLAAGANSAVITPAINKPVLVMGCCTVFDHQGVSQVSLLHFSVSGIVFIAWFGLDTTTPATVTTGSTSTTGTHIVYIESTHEVEIQVASADTIRVHNGAAATRAGNVTLIW